MKPVRTVLVGILSLGVMIPGCSCDVTASNSGCRDSSERLVEAAAQGDLDVVLSELASGTSPDVVDDSGNRALTCAGPAGRVEIVEELLKAGADPNVTSRDGDTATTDAIRFCRSEVLGLLLDADADPDIGSRGNSALTQAVDLGDVESVELLIAHNADMSKLGRQTLNELSDQESTSPCPSPTAQGRSESLLKVSEAGADPSTVLSLAAWWDLPKPLSDALKRGADPDEGELIADLGSFSCDSSIPIEDLQSKPSGSAAGSTTAVAVTTTIARPVAGVNRCAPIVGLMRLAFGDEAALAGGLVTATGSTEAGQATEPPTPLRSPPLIDLAWWGDVESVRLMLDNGANMYVEGERGLTPLHAAAAVGQVEVVQFLLDKGASRVSMPGIPKPSELARRGGHLELAETLNATGS